MAISCGRPQDVQGANSGGITGLLQGIHNTVRVNEELATMARFHQALRARRSAIACIRF
ncbi:MAG: hypothetical protein R2932_57465 [Caldilineaceae bacterium]